MKIGAIVSEFNPFHNGHKHIIDCAKKEVCSHIISIMSGNYVQRGEPAIFSKRHRAEVALKNGVDLVVELPSAWSVSRAERYAEAGVWLADALGCVDSLIFGSECGDLSKLLRIEETFKDEKFHEILLKHLNKGMTFAKARELAVRELNSVDDVNRVMNSPNNILGIEYIKAINSFDSLLKPTTFMRDKALMSSSEIRELMKMKNNMFVEHVPSNANYNLENMRDIFWGEKAIISALLMLSSSDFNKLPDISEGLDNKIYSSLKECDGLNNLFELVKSKRYTMSRIKRIIMCAYLGITEDVQKSLPPYIRVLGATKKGLEILKLASRTTKLPIVSTCSSIKELDGFSRKVFEIECRATNLLCVFDEHVCSVESEQKFKFIRQEYL